MKLSKQIMFLRSRLYLLASIVIVAGIILIVLLNRSTLNVTFAPTEAVVTLDNAPLNTLPNGTARIITRPGNHVLKVEADGYVAEIQNIKLKGGRSQAFKFDLVAIPKPYELSTNDIKNIAVDAITSGDEAGSVFFLGNGRSAIFKAKFNADKSLQTVSQITNPSLSGITDIFWSPKKDAIIYKKSDGVYYLDFQKFNFISQQEVKIGDGSIGDIAWSPDDSKIAYYYAPGTGEQSLVFAGRTNSNPVKVANLADLEISNPYLAWSPSSEWLAVIPRNTDANSNKLYLFNAYTREIKAISESGNIVKASFSPDSGKVIYATNSPDPTTPIPSVLSIMNIDGEEIKSLDLRADIGKVTWLDNDHVAVATYDPELKIETLFRYNVVKKQKEGFSIPLVGAYVTSLVTGNDAKTLYFTIAGKLYATTP